MRVCVCVCVCVYLCVIYSRCVAIICECVYLCVSEFMHTTCILQFSVGIKAMETLIDNVQSEVRDESSVLWTAGDD